MADALGQRGGHEHAPGALGWGMLGGLGTLANPSVPWKVPGWSHSLPPHRQRPLLTVVAPFQPLMIVLPTIAADFWSGEK